MTDVRPEGHQPALRPVERLRPATLPPGQRRIARFPRFGTHLGRPAPAVPEHPVIAVGGEVAEPFDVPLAALAALPRTEIRADFHCVAGWSAVDLRWEGVAFADFFRSVIASALAPGTTITHVLFRGLDGYRSVVLLEDVLADDVLIADRLDGHPLGADHGAPVRLVSPAQYGYISTKHLCRVEVHSTEPAAARPSDLSDRLLRSHPRARVREEERHGSLPGWLVRPFYRMLKAPTLYLCARGERRPTSRVPNAVLGEHPWRIRQIAPDFTVEDVWELPVQGCGEDFDVLLDLMASLEFPDSASLPTRVLWSTRDLLGRWFGLGRVSTPADDTGSRPIPGSDTTSLIDRLPDDLRGTAADLARLDKPFVPLYRTDDEYAAELSNRTVHAVLHLAWVGRDDGRFQGQMAVFVKPRGRLGRAYMAFIKPFRYRIVYPALMRSLERAWRRRAGVTTGVRS